MKRKFNNIVKNYNSREEPFTIKLDKYDAARLYIALLASKTKLRESVYFSEEYDFVCDLIYELGKYRRKK